MSVNAGETEKFKIKTDARSYTVKIYRLGYYQGNGARYIADVPVTATLPQTQPACATDATTEIYDCGTWGVSASWTVPSTAVSGVYLARLYRADRDDASLIPFIVRNDASHSDVVFQTSDPTWQAYNTYGGSDFYQGLANGRAYKVSYNRPFATGWRQRRPGLPVLQRVSDDPFPRAERLRRLLHLRSGHRHPRFLADEPQGVPVGGPRRVLVGRPTHERGERPRRRGEPRLLVRQRGLLEDALGSERGRDQHRQSNLGLLQGHLGRHPDRSRDADGDLARSAVR